MSEQERILQALQDVIREVEQQGTEQAFKDAFESSFKEDQERREAEDGTAAREAEEGQTELEKEARQEAEKSLNDAFYEGLDSITDSPFGELINGVIYAAMETSRLAAAEIMPALEKALDAGIEASGYSTQMQTANNDYLKVHLAANEAEAGKEAEAGRTTGAEL